MEKINNLVYTLEINYINNSSLDTSIAIKFYDNGLKIKSIKIGDVCITEETIKRRVLSGRFDNSDFYCGYRYDYQNGENLLNINPDISIDTAISLISNTKMKHDFLSAELVISSILRNDYRVLALNEGCLNIIKTVYAENEKSKHYTLQECISLLKLDGEEMFVEKDKKKIYKIDDNCLVEENETVLDSDIKSQLNELSYIISQNPHSYKDLIKLKNQILENSINNTISSEKTL